MGRIVIDCDIPSIRGVFEQYFEVEYLKGADINRSAIEGASALVVRTRTKCNEELLSGSGVEAIATATIGVDHIDREYCEASGVAVYSSAGCNSRAVAQWVYTVIDTLKRPSGSTIGIIGVGSVGSEVEAAASGLGFKVLRCDPPRAEREGQGGFVELEYLLKSSDIVTIHTPLTSETDSMVNSHFLGLMRPDALLLNSSRGEVVVEGDLLNSMVDYALDVWRAEPNINIELMEGARIATPHIAGYSARGKARATTMVVQAIARHFGIDALLDWDCAAEMELEDLLDFDVMEYHRALRSRPEEFESLRTIR